VILGYEERQTFIKEEPWSQYQGFDYISYYNGAFEDADSLGDLLQTEANAVALNRNFRLDSRATRDQEFESSFLQRDLEKFVPRRELDPSTCVSRRGDRIPHIADAADIANCQRP
jgi:hypothetical protein